MKPQSFSVQARLKSFQYSFEGIAQFFKREHNSWLHFAATVAVIITASVVGVTKTELLAIVFAIGFVWVAEMFNTCIEHIMDFISTKTDPEIRFIKDLASGAVLVSGITALIVGLIIFIPKFFN